MGFHGCLGQGVGQVVATAVQGGEEGAIAEVSAIDICRNGVRRHPCNIQRRPVIQGCENGSPSRRCKPRWQHRAACPRFQQHYDGLAIDSENALALAARYCLQDCPCFRPEDRADPRRRHSGGRGPDDAMYN